jgi:RNA polymerase sigma factor (TIGR02999 family)
VVCVKAEATMSFVADRQALDEVFSLTYEELRRLARSILRGEGVARLTPTTLVNEAWLRLAPYPKLADTSPLHFRRIAGRAMRQVLVDAARRRQAQIHGGDLLQVTFDEALGLAQQTNGARDVLALDAALDRLRTFSPRQAELVELRFFGGLNCDEAALALGISEATVMRDWRAARAWLAREVKCLLGESTEAERAPALGPRAKAGEPA